MAADSAGAAVRLSGLDIYAGAPETGSERNRASAAQKVQTLFIDDLDGSAGEGTVRFGLNGTEYEIDLNAMHAQELRVAWPAMWVPPGGLALLSGGQAAELAEAQGIEVKDRGRVPADLVARFNEATGQ